MKRNLKFQRAVHLLYTSIFKQDIRVPDLIPAVNDARSLSLFNFIKS